VCGIGFIAEGMYGYSLLFLPFLTQKASVDGVIIALYQMFEYCIIERKAKE
jgi:hypothetical protein